MICFICDVKPRYKSWEQKRKVVSTKKNIFISRSTVENIKYYDRKSVLFSFWNAILCQDYHQC
jgi:hypothetical protein